MSKRERKTKQILLAVFCAISIQAWSAPPVWSAQPAPLAGVSTQKEQDAPIDKKTQNTAGDEESAVESATPTVGGYSINLLGAAPRTGATGAVGDISVAGGAMTGVTSINGAYLKVDSSDKESNMIFSNVPAAGTLKNVTSFGLNGSVSGEGASAFGAKAQVNGDFSSAIGAQALANSYCATAIGALAKAVYSRSTALGHDASAAADNAMALGADTQVDHINSVALGQGSKTSAANQVAFGNLLSSNGTNTYRSLAGIKDIAMTGALSGVTALNGIRIDASRNLTNAGTYNGVTIGSGGINGVTIGSGGINGATITGTAFNGVTIGSGKVNGIGIDASGNLTNVSSINGAYFNVNSGLDVRNMIFGKAPAAGTWKGVTIFGITDVVSGSYATVFGAGAGATGYSASVFGSSATADGVSAVAVGDGASAMGKEAIAVGKLSIAEGTWASAFGAETHAMADNASAFGSYAEASAANNVAIGYMANALSSNTVAVGANTTTHAANSVALGNDSKVDIGHTNSLALGQGSKTSAANQVAFGDLTPSGNASSYRSLAGIKDIAMTGALSGVTALNGISIDASGNLTDAGTYNGVTIGSGGINGATITSTSFNNVNIAALKATVDDNLGGISRTKIDSSGGEGADNFKTTVEGSSSFTTAGITTNSITASGKVTAGEFVEGSTKLSDKYAGKSAFDTLNATVTTAGTGLVAKTTALEATVGDAASGLVKDVADNTAGIASKANADASGLTDPNKAAWKTALGVDTLATTVAGKAEKATTLAGYGITDAYTKTEANTELAKKVDVETYTSRVTALESADTALAGRASALERKTGMFNDNGTELVGMTNITSTSATLGGVTFAANGVVTNVASINGIGIAVSGTTDKTLKVSGTVDATTLKQGGKGIYTAEEIDAKFGTSGGDVSALTGRVTTAEGKITTLEDNTDGITVDGGTTKLGNGFKVGTTAYGMDNTGALTANSIKEGGVALSDKYAGKSEAYTDAKAALKADKTYVDGTFAKTADVTALETKTDNLSGTTLTGMTEITSTSATLGGVTFAANGVVTNVASINGIGIAVSGTTAKTLKVSGTVDATTLTQGGKGIYTAEEIDAKFGTSGGDVSALTGRVTTAEGKITTLEDNTDGITVDGGTTKLAKGFKVGTTAYGMDNTGALTANSINGAIITQETFNGAAISSSTFNGVDVEALKNTVDDLSNTGGTTTANTKGISRTKIDPSGGEGADNFKTTVEGSSSFTTAGMKTTMSALTRGIV